MLPPQPSSSAGGFRNADLAELAACIDWGPFFQTWDLAGRYPAILDDAVVGERGAQGVRRCTGDARARPSPAAGCTAMASSRCCRPTRWTTTPSRFYTDASAPRWRCAGARCASRPSGRTDPGPTANDQPPNRCLADFIAPCRQRPTAPTHRPVRRDRRPRHRGEDGAVLRPSTTTTRRSCSRRWPTAWPRPSPSGCTSACAPSSGLCARDEALSNASSSPSLPRYPPAPGYPACPGPPRQARDVRSLGRRRDRDGLTENLAMTPAASVRGLPGAPEARYFNVGRIGGDQLAEWAIGEGLPLEQARHWRRCWDSCRAAAWPTQQNRGPARDAAWRMGRGPWAQLRQSVSRHP